MGGSSLIAHSIDRQSSTEYAYFPTPSTTYISQATLAHSISGEGGDAHARLEPASSPAGGEAVDLLHFNDPKDLIEKEVTDMAQYLVFHTYDPKLATSATQMAVTKTVIEGFTTDTYCITSWAAVGAGKIACLWEATSEQAIIDAFAKVENIPIDGIYPASVIDWAEMKKMLA